MLRWSFRISLFILISGVSAARGEIVTLGRYGLWDAFAGIADSGSAVCGISQFGRDGRGFMVKYFAPEDTLAVQISKETWAIPNDTKIRIRIQFDNNDAWIATATGYKKVVQLFVPLNETTQFLNELRWSNQIRIWFLDGDEGGWSGGLQGSNAAVGMMGQCLNVMFSKGQMPTQPYNQSQPYNRPQPYNGAPSAPTQPWSQPSTPAPQAPATYPPQQSGGRNRT